MTIQRADLSSFAATLRRADATTQGPGELDRAIRSEGPTQGPATGDGVGGVSFADRVEQVLDEVNGVQVHANEAAQAYANGERNDMHGTMIALEQADVTFRLVSNIRSRMIEAYREVMRMGS